MERIFNTSGPVEPAEHYAFDPLDRLDWEEVRHLIVTKRYFVLHAPRQTGKTSTLPAMMAALNGEGCFACAYTNIEGAQAARGDAPRGILSVCDTLAESIGLYLRDTHFKSWYDEFKSTVSPLRLLTSLLQQWAQTSFLPVVLLLDEVDALVGDTLISLLRKIRAGYHQRPAAFPQSIILPLGPVKKQGSEGISGRLFPAPVCFERQCSHCVLLPYPVRREGPDLAL